MARYIDVIEAEAAIKDLFADMPRIEFMGNRRRWREENEQYLRCLDVLRSVPTADVVEVVRCKECKHKDTETGLCEGRGWPMQLVPDDGFCDKGKRRTDDGEIH